MIRVASVSAGRGYTLKLAFTDGTGGTLDLSSRLFGPMFEPPRDPAEFSQVRVDDYGTVCWPNGADLAPDALYKTISSRADPRIAVAS